MVTVAKAFVLFAAALASIVFFVSSEDLSSPDCGDVQHDVENGMIRLPDFSGENIRDLNCSWTYTAPPGRKLLVKVDSVHLPPLDLRTSQLQLYVDDKFYDIPRNCVKCLRDMVGGKVLNVVFTSYAAPFTESHELNPNETSVNTEGIGSFQVRYKAFDPHRCGKPEQIDNGSLLSKGRKVGQSIFYSCNPPFDLIGESELKCITTNETPVPDWNNKPPKCLIQDCTGEPVVKRISPGAIASPGYPDYIYEFTAPCVWQVLAQPHQQIKVSVTYLKLPKPNGNSFSESISRLSLIDGDSSHYIVNLTESVTNGPLNFTTLTNKLTIELSVSEDPKRKEETGAYIEYSFVSSSCPKPNPPENGDVIVYSIDLGSTIAYTCKQGFVLVGELHSECLLNGQWSHPSPTCEPLKVNLTPLLSASNDSDTVTAKLSEIPVSTEITKYSKNGRKKATESIPFKDSFNFTGGKEMSAVPNDNQDIVPPTAENGKISSGKAGKNGDTGSGSGPKSEPHLLQVVPPKQAGKNTVDQENSFDREPVNASEPVDQLPTVETGFSQSFGAFKLSLTTIYIIAGVTVPVLVLIIILIVIIIYRRRYPVRMRFGRKFSTFENPMYVTKDAQHPRELKRLTN